MLRHVAALAVTAALIGSGAPVTAAAAPVVGPPGAAFYVPRRRCRPAGTAT